ncbi:uncharacterized protein PFL1_04135 [Pseudozyma flocculosa PF-1]|uniref:peptidylprolyl isomerase n=1 Tax=Pseudozyma flocculosa PF-1 TaxID=1277687 RepID=A0A061H6Q3_9BASI|nr:uncharacterized protein PFL1_04135 [Pseudozyma flocculosa PF-1]EPQ28308.1 hypothetical protein PFL1_04135 [Pseudozyma flocculosa PF-1]
MRAHPFSSSSPSPPHPTHQASFHRLFVCRTARRHTLNLSASPSRAPQPRSSMAVPTIGYISICSGDPAAHAAAQASFEATEAQLRKIAADYGLAPDLDKLDEEGREILAGSDPNLKCTFTAPPPHRAGRVYIHLLPSDGLKRTRSNFTALLTGSKGACKADRSKRLHYLGTPFHRVETDFVVQGGDVTRGDGSGGEAVHAGGSFKVEVEGLKTVASYGSLAMAASRKDVNTSQFFFLLTDAPSQLAKVQGKYSVFGQALVSSQHLLNPGLADVLRSHSLDPDQVIREGEAVFRRFKHLASPDGRPRERVWIDECGIL